MKRWLPGLLALTLSALVPMLRARASFGPLPYWRR